VSKRIYVEAIRVMTVGHKILYFYLGRFLCVLEGFLLC